MAEIKRQILGDEKGDHVVLESSEFESAFQGKAIELRGTLHTLEKDGTLTAGKPVFGFWSKEVYDAKIKGIPSEVVSALVQAELQNRQIAAVVPLEGLAQRILKSEEDFEKGGN